MEVDLFDARRKLAAIALVTMVTPASLAAAHCHDTTATPFDVHTTPFETPPHRAPMQESLHTLREENGVYVRVEIDDTIRPNVDGTTSPIGTITVPWEDVENTGPEVACLAADPMVATAVLQTFVRAEVLGPNPDLSLRFTTAPATRVVQTSGTVLSVQQGTATVAIEVHAGDQHLAHGLGTSLLLNRE